MVDHPFAIQNSLVSEDDLQMVGAYVPRHLADQLSLWALYYGTTKTDLIRAMIEERSKKEPSPTEIIEVLKARAWSGWQRQLELNEGKKHWQSNEEIEEQRRSYAKKIINALLRRNLNSPVVNQITEAIK